MDLQTDQKVREIIAEELKGCTVLAVAHRIGESVYVLTQTLISNLT